MGSDFCVNVVQAWSTAEAPGLKAYIRTNAPLVNLQEVAESYLDEEESMSPSAIAEKLCEAVDELTGTRRDTAVLTLGNQDWLIKRDEAMKVRIHLTPAEFDTVLAALRHWARCLDVPGSGISRDLIAIAEDHGKRLDSRQVDELGDRLNQEEEEEDGGHCCGDECRSNGCAYRFK